VFVHFSYGLENRGDFEALTKGNEYYIFAAFVVKDGRQLCVFGNTRRHRELEKAIVDDIGVVDKCIYGQLWLKGPKAKSLAFISPLGENDHESKENLLLCLGSIRDDLLDKDMIVKDNKNKYFYDNRAKSLVRDSGFSARRF
jgi:hypothetical protein